MKALLVFALIAGLTESTGPGVVQEQVTTQLSGRHDPVPGETAGPLARAVKRLPVPLDIGPSLPRPALTGQQASAGWSRVGRLKAGTRIIVTVTSASPVTRHFLLSDDTSVTLLNLTHPNLSSETRQELLDVGSRSPELFSSDRTDFAGKVVRVGPDGVFAGGQKVAELGEVVERVARTDVRLIMRPERTRGSRLGLIAGAAGGFLLGYGLAVATAYEQCEDSCSDEKARMALYVTGLPVAGGVLGYHAYRTKYSEAIYRSR